VVAAATGTFEIVRIHSDTVILCCCRLCWQHYARYGVSFEFILIYISSWFWVSCLLTFREGRNLRLSTSTHQVLDTLSTRQDHRPIVALQSKSCIKIHQTHHSSRRTLLAKWSKPNRANHCSFGCVPKVICPLPDIAPPVSGFPPI
jgi:hypothetical protein